MLRQSRRRPPELGMDRHVAASTSPTPRSSLRPSIPCTPGTPRRPYATSTCKMCVHTGQNPRLTIPNTQKPLTWSGSTLTLAIISSTYHNRQAYCQFFCPGAPSVAFMVDPGGRVAPTTIRTTTVVSWIARSRNRWPVLNLSEHERPATFSTFFQTGKYDFIWCHPT